MPKTDKHTLIYTPLELKHMKETPKAIIQRDDNVNPSKGRNIVKLNGTCIL